jgi:hypothetical protein
MIERVRQQPTVPLEEAESHLDAADSFEAKHGRPMTSAEARSLLVKKTRPAPPNKATQPKRAQPRSALATRSRNLSCLPVGERGIQEAAWKTTRSTG